ncbi:MAG: excinuclease ABC subunit UvrC [Bacillota bacterium]|nr:excinuclease ABC subunit UvrC [Bacillota bacterium]
MFDIKQNLQILPTKPGVYMHKDKLGNIIYVGKAVNLRNRVRQYFQSQKNMAPKVRSMVENIAEFEYITVESEMEALILECNLIKKHQPKYNILLRDDKSYPYIKVTSEEWPRVIKTRIYKKDGGEYFGPYSDVGAVNKIVELLNESFELKKCSTVHFASGFRPCLNYHIGLCYGVCQGRADKEKYADNVAKAVDFLRGHDKQLVNHLKEKMMKASEDLNYEDAATYRDYIEAAKSLSETQRVVLHHSNEADIVVKVPSSEELRLQHMEGESKVGASPLETKIVKRGEGEDNKYAHIAVFRVREGKLIDRNSFRIDVGSSIDDNTHNILSEFIKQHYSATPNIPREILVDKDLEQAGMIEGFLSDIAEHRISILKPERGEKRALVKLALKDAEEMAKTIEARAKASRERKEKLGREIWNVLREMNAIVGSSYDGREFRVEAYDISNTNGVDTVGAMVVFQGLKPDKKEYRKFKIRTVQGQDDYGAMTEVLSRRFLRAFANDEKFSVLPDIIFMDGGKGHVNTALAVIEETGLEVPVVGMVKDDHHRTRALTYKIGDSWKEVSLDDKPMLLRFIGRVQEEVHRFAIEYHHKVRDKNVIKSLLDEIEGVGPQRRRALLEEFGSVENLRVYIKNNQEKAESIERIAKIPGMNQTVAEKVCDFFRMMI